MMPTKASQTGLAIKCSPEPTARTPELRSFSNPCLEWAESYLNRGFSVVPIRARSKIPSVLDWPNLRVTKMNLDEYFHSPPQNVGVQLGERSGWLVDVDLDSPEAVKLADVFLPPTASRFGRKGKSSSHRLFVSKDAEYVKFKIPMMRASQNEDDRNSE